MATNIILKKSSLNDLIFLMPQSFIEIWRTIFVFKLNKVDLLNTILVV